MSLLPSILGGTRFSRAALILCSAALATSASAQVTLISDNFDGANLDTSAWTFAQTNASVAVGGGALTLSTTNTGSGQRGMIASATTSTNPFANPVTITLSGISLTSDSTVARSRGYVVLGRRATDTGGTPPNDYVTDATYGTGGAVGMMLERWNNANPASVYYTLKLSDMGTDNTGITYTLSGAPTDIIWTIDNTSVTYTHSFELIGATIVSISGAGTGVGTSIGSASWNEAFARFTADDLLVGEDSISRVVVGVQNAGTLDTGTYSHFLIDSITVSAVPEPSTYALIASAFICGFVVIRRRRMPQAS